MNQSHRSKQNYKHQRAVMVIDSFGGIPFIIWSCENTSLRLAKETTPVIQKLGLAAPLSAPSLAVSCSVTSTTLPTGAPLWCKHRRSTECWYSTSVRGSHYVRWRPSITYGWKFFWSLHYCFPFLYVQWSALKYILDQLLDLKWMK